MSTIDGCIVCKCNENIIIISLDGSLVRESTLRKLRQCAMAAIYAPWFSHISSAKFISVHYMKVYSGFFIFSSINRKKGVSII